MRLHSGVRIPSKRLGTPERRICSLRFCFRLRTVVTFRLERIPSRAQGAERLGATIRPPPWHVAITGNRTRAELVEDVLLRDLGFHRVLYRLPQPARRAFSITTDGKSCSRFCRPRIGYSTEEVINSPQKRILLYVGSNRWSVGIER